MVIDPDWGCLHEGNGGNLWLGPPKTESSARTISLPGFLVPLLRRHLETVRSQYVFVTPDGKECSFRGVYLEIEPPTRIVATWLFEGWPDAEAVETEELHETDDYPRTASGKVQKHAVRQALRERIAIPRNREYRSHS